MINFMLITNDPELAHYAEKCGVSRIFVDLERNGKLERQGHLDTLISSHSMDDISVIKKQLTSAQLLVRLNPLYHNTKLEIDRAVNSGADWLMLPMYRTADEVRNFIKLVNKRARVILLLETCSAYECLDEVVKIPGIDEIYIGLNDLHLDMGLNFMFEPLANGTVDKMVKIISSAGLAFGFGGIARVNEGVIPGEVILAEHLRLGSSSVILSRTFHRKSENASEFKSNLDLKKELGKLLIEGEKLKTRNIEQINEDHKKLQYVVNQYVAGKPK